MLERCDLHCHSNKSDGTDSPQELIEKASLIGLKAIALTDHDTIEGIQEAAEISPKYGIDFLNGVEISVISQTGHMHILGYLFDPNSKILNDTLIKLQKARAERNTKMISKLNELGIPLTLKDVEAHAHGGEIGRPHFALALYKNGYVSSIQMAFEKYLKKDAPAYVPKSILLPHEAISIIHQAGGLAILAHPISLKIENPDELKKLIEELYNQGLDGIECFYPEHDEFLTRYLLNLCKFFNIVPTGGSDYHGQAKPFIKLGSGKGNLHIPYECVIALKRRRYKI